MDIQIENHGTVALARPLTPAGKQWLHDMTQHEGWQWLGEALAVEPRMVGNLVEGAREDGLEVG